MSGNLDTSYFTLAGYSAGKEFGLQNKIKKASVDMVAKVIIPTAIIAPIVVMTKNIKQAPKFIILIPVTLASLS